MHGYICKKCGGLCDAGEIRNDKCLDCIEAERQIEIRTEWNRKMLAKSLVEQSDGQLILGGLVN